LYNESVNIHNPLPPECWETCTWFKAWTEANYIESSPDAIRQLGTLGVTFDSGDETCPQPGPGIVRGTNDLTCHALVSRIRLSPVGETP